MDRATRIHLMILGSRRCCCTSSSLASADKNKRYHFGLQLWKF